MADTEFKEGSGTMTVSQPADVGGSPIKRAMENVWASGEYSDVTVTCKGRIWLAHKLVLCTQSQYFKRMCESNFKEAKENHIDLPEDDPEIVDRLLAYLYHGDYDDNGMGTTPPLLLHLQLFELADRCLMKPLCDLVTKKFNDRVNTDWNTSSFAEAVVKVSSLEGLVGDVDTLKLIVLEVTRMHARQLFDESAHAAFLETILTAPKFLLEYSKSVSKEPCVEKKVVQEAGMVWYRCPGYMCRKQRGVFGVKEGLPDKFMMNCPLRCTKDQSMGWWAEHKVQRSQEATPAKP